MRSLFEIEIAGKKRALEYGCDSDINDTEQAPLSEATNEHAGGLEAFIALEVHLSAAGALNNASNTGIGYESNYTRYSYQSTGDAHSRLNPH